MRRLRESVVWDLLGKRPRERWSVGSRDVGVGKLENTDVVLKRRRWREVLRLDLRLGLESVEVGVFDVDLGVLDVEDGGEARGVMSKAGSSSDASVSAWLRGS